MDGCAPRAWTSAPHGVKRRADDDPRDDQRLAKRFDLLNLEHSSKLYVPIPGASNASHQSIVPNGFPPNDSMHLDDTRNKIYIHDLDEQLDEIESEEKMVFLPDIEKKLREIPHYVLTGDLKPTQQNQMVLYGVPASISVPEDQDNVRKAIIESRARMREKQLLDNEAAKARSDPVREAVSGELQGTNFMNTQRADVEEDEDAMDLG